MRLADPTHHPVHSPDESKTPLAADAVEGRSW